jgi:hypothetical protein
MRAWQEICLWYDIQAMKIALLAAAIVLSYPLENTPLQQKKISQTANHARESGNPQATTPKSAINIQQYEDLQDDPTKGKKHNHDYELWGLVVNAVLVIVTAVIAGIALIQAIAAKRAVKAQMDSDRSWIIINKIGNPEGLYIPEKAYIPGILYVFKVSGNTIVRIRNLGFRFHPVPRKPGIGRPEPDLEAVPNYSEPRGQRPTLEIPEGGMVIAPDGTFTVDDFLESAFLEAEEFEELKRGEKVMCAYGFVEYNDAFDRPIGMTRFCFIYDFQFGGVFRTPDGTVLNPAGFRPGGPSAYHETR